MHSIRMKSNGVCIIRTRPSLRVWDSRLGCYHKGAHKDGIRTMPVPVVPYPSQQQMSTAQSNGSQGQLVCSGCRTLLVYPQGAANVRCALCSTVTSVPPPGTEMAQLICGGCRTLLMYVRGATSVHCSCCHTVNLAMEANQAAHVTCGGCGTMLMYPYGAQSVKCAVCQFVTPTAVNNMRVPLPMQRTSSNASSSQPSTPQQPQSHTQTVVVENPMTLDESGKLVSNVAIGTTERK